MNIFYLDRDYVECAKQHCDKHVVKMCTEYAQLLSTAHRVIDGEVYTALSKNGRKIKRYSHPEPEMDETLYLACHVNHPSNIWVRECALNYYWLFDMWVELCDEYEHRYGREHASMTLLGDALSYAPRKINYNKPFTQPTPAMKQYPECVVPGDSLASYRNFYWADKREFASWSKRDKPEWWVQLEQEAA